MGKFRDYKLDLKGLQEGKHNVNYVLDNHFFTLINDDESDIHRGNLDVNLNIERVGNVFDLNFKINGIVFLPCDRCLDDIDMNVDIRNNLIVKFGEEYSDENDEVVIIPETEGYINLSWFIYEFIVLSLPIKRIHQSGQCNKAVISKLKKHKINLNEEDVEDIGDDDYDLEETIEESIEIDPRWNALKNMNECFE